MLAQSGEATMRRPAPARCYGAVSLVAASVFLLHLPAVLLLTLTALLSRGRRQPLFFSFPTAPGARAHEED